MGKYYYERSLREYISLDDIPKRLRFKSGFGINTNHVSTEKQLEIKNARKNKKYIIVKNRCPGINTSLIYIDVDDFKLNLEGGKFFYFYTKSKYSSEESIYTPDEILNLDVLKGLYEDVRFSKKYVESYVSSILGYGKDIDKHEKLIKKALSHLSDAARLAYEII